MAQEQIQDIPPKDNPEWIKVSNHKDVVIEQQDFLACHFTSGLQHVFPAHPSAAALSTVSADLKRKLVVTASCF